VGLVPSPAAASLTLEMSASFNVILRKLVFPPPARRCVSSTSLMCLSVRQDLRRLGEALSTSLPTTTPAYACSSGSSAGCALLATVEEPEVVLRILSGRAIAKTVGVSEATVRRILRGSQGCFSRRPVAVPCV
jgi:hypothetical protein